MTDTQFWADKLADEIVAERGDRDHYIFNAGMSVSGRMHIGNLRGELVIPSRVQHILESRDADVTFRGVYYTQDRFKGKDEQLQQFDDPGDAERYAGWRLIDVPDPAGCHDNWVDHFNAANQPYLSDYGIDIDPLTTTEFYTMQETKDLVRRFLEERGTVREILNEFRDRQPYPEDWIPYDPLCTECNRIDTTDALEIDFDEDRVRYRCTDCGAEGWSPLEKGKLAWRLEWAALWHVLDVDFEPYGKDHATPGGSRDSAIAIAEAFDLNYPAGFSFNWVYLKQDGDTREMTSSGDIGITAEEFLDLAAPPILTYLYLSTRPMTEIMFDPADLPTYHRRFDRAERVYFGAEELDDEKEERNITRSYELAMIDIPDEQPVRVDYEHAAFVAQTVPRDDWDTRGKQVLQATGHLPDDVSDADWNRTVERMECALHWARTYAPDKHVYTFNEDVHDDIRDDLSEEELDAMRALRDLLKEQDYDDKDALEDDIFTVARDSDVSVGAFFSAAYRCLLSRDSGPRLADFILTRGQDAVEQVLETLD